MKIRVIVFEVAIVEKHQVRIRHCDVYREYEMDHNDPAQRRVLGEQCRNAFEGGQCVITYPVAS
jgi:hypothetical protein